jgi:predicted membrane channel-forming protein YqfA (hemolysin III family)
VLAYDYPLLGVFWTLVFASLAVLVLFVIIWTLIDNFRRKDHGGLAKVLWLVFIVVLPIIGVFVYLLTRPADVDAVVVYEEETVVGRP